MTKYYMGITALHHDSSVALLDSGSNIINAAKEESFSCVRGDKSWPTQAIEWSIKDAKARGYLINTHDITYGYYENPWVKFKRQAIETPMHSLRLLALAQKPKINIKNLIYGDHHMSHALTAIKTSPFNEGFYIIADGGGENKSMSWGEFKNNKVMETGFIKYPNSLGILYAAFMNMISLKPNRDEWKLDQFRQTGKISIDIKEMIYDRLVNLTDQAFELKINLNKPNKMASMFRYGTIDIMGIPDWVVTLDAVIVEILSHVCNKNFYNNNNTMPLVFSGGLANNISICSDLKNGLWCSKIWVPPYPGNGGSAIGAALACIQEPQLNNYHTTFHGPSLDDGAKVTKMLLQNIIKRLNEGQVIAWMQGPEEFSQNGAGHRYLIADPRNKGACERMSAISGKAGPYVDTVAILDEFLDVYFDVVNNDYYQTGMMAGKLRNTKIFNGIANTTPRILTISQSIDCFRSLMLAWSKNTECDILACNNLIQYTNDADIVIKTRQQAMKFLIDSDVDCVVIGNRVYYKVEHNGLSEQITMVAAHDDYSKWACNG